MLIGRCSINKDVFFLFFEFLFYINLRKGIKKTLTFSSQTKSELLVPSDNIRSKMEDFYTRVSFSPQTALVFHVFLVNGSRKEEAPSGPLLPLTHPWVTL